MTRRRRIARGLAEAALWTLAAVAVYLAVGAWQARDTVEGFAPELAGPVVGEVPVRDLESLEQPAVIYFWATWCGICRMNNPAVERLAEDHPVITVALGSGDAEAVRDYLRREGRTFPAVVDDQGRLADAYGVKGVPTVFIVDTRGRIRHASVGYASNWALRARLWWVRWSPG